MHWCGQDRDVLQIQGKNLSDIADLDSEIAKLESSLAARIIHDELVSQETRVLVQRHEYSKMEPNINAIIEECNCIEIPPTVYKEASEWYRILAVTQKDVAKLFKTLSDSTNYKILSRTNLPSDSIGANSSIPIGGLFEQLTFKQFQVLELALNLGYYKTPRKVRAEELAQILSVPRTTFEEHRRKAECKLMTGLAPYIKMARPKSSDVPISVTARRR